MTIKGKEDKATVQQLMALSRQEQLFKLFRNAIVLGAKDGVEPWFDPNDDDGSHTIRWVDHGTHYHIMFKPNNTIRLVAVNEKRLLGSVTFKVENEEKP